MNSIVPRSASALKRLSICFYIALCSVFIVIAAATTGVDIENIETALLVVFIACYLAFLFFLGTLAAELGKNSVLWVGLTLISFPVGWLAAYLLIKNQVTAR